MPLDFAQFLRNSIPVDRYDAVRDAAQEAGKAEAAAQTGSVMGTAFVVESDPMAELMDSMEELTFMFEETETKEVAERKLGEEHDNPYLKALEGWKALMPDMPDEQFTRSLLALLKQAQNRGQLPTADTLLRQVAEGSKDPSHQFAILSALEEAFGGAEGSEFRELLRSARETLESTRGEEIRAGINLAKEVNARATSPEEMQGLRDLYRGEILGFSTPQQCFRSIMEKRGAAGLQAAIDFLTAGCGSDLQSASPSRSPEELRRIILDLQCVQVLKTVLDRMTQLGSRMEQQFGQQCLRSGEQMTGSVLNFTEQPFVSSNDIAAFLNGCGIEQLLARMDFCRELTAIFRGLSPRLFDNEQARLRLVDAAQEHLDGIVDEEYEQEQQEEDEREERK